MGGVHGNLLVFRRIVAILPNDGHQGFTIGGLPLFIGKVSQSINGPIERGARPGRKLSPYMIGSR